MNNVLIIILFSLYHITIFSQEDIFTGAQARGASGAGQTVSRGASALTSNPANVIYSKFIEFNFDLGVALINMDYVRIDDSSTEYEVINVKETIPQISTGLSIRFMPSFTIAAVFSPIFMNKKRSILNEAIESVDKVTFFDRVDTKSYYRYAFGAAFRPGYYLSLGVSYIINNSKGTEEYFLKDEEETNKAKSYTFQTGQFILGVRSELFSRRLVFGASYKSASINKHSGKIVLAKSDEEIDIEETSYNPAEIGGGLEYRYSSLAIFVDYIRKIWSKGGLLTLRADPAYYDLSDYIDTNNIVAGLKVWFSDFHMLLISYGNYSPSLGEGNLSENSTTLGLLQEADGLEESFYGARFGELGIFSKNIFSGAYRLKIKKHGYVIIGASYLKGLREVGASADGAGVYQYTNISMSVGGSLGF